MCSSLSLDKGKQQRWFCNPAESELTLPLLAWPVVHQLLCLSAHTGLGNWGYARFLVRQFHLCNGVVFNNVVKVLRAMTAPPTLHPVQCFKRQLEKTLETLRPSAGDARSHCVLKPVPISTLSNQDEAE